MDALPEQGGRASHRESCYRTEGPLTSDLEISTKSLARSSQPSGNREEELMALWPLVMFAFSTLYLNYLSFYFFVTS